LCTVCFLSGHTRHLGGRSCRVLPLRVHTAAEQAASLGHRVAVATNGPGAYLFYCTLCGHYSQAAVRALGKVCPGPIQTKMHASLCRLRKHRHPITNRPLGPPRRVPSTPKGRAGPTPSPASRPTPLAAAASHAEPRAGEDGWRWPQAGELLLEDPCGVGTTRWPNGTECRRRQLQRPHYTPITMPTRVKTTKTPLHLFR
jgi:hypothetical protein